MSRNRIMFKADMSRYVQQIYWSLGYEFNAHNFSCVNAFNMKGLPILLATSNMVTTPLV